MKPTGCGACARARGITWLSRSTRTISSPRSRRWAEPAAGDAPPSSLRGEVALVRRGVVDVIEGRDEVHLDAAELALEGADVLPRMVGRVLRRDPPEVVPLAAPRLRPAHDLEM